MSTRTLKVFGAIALAGVLGILVGFFVGFGVGRYTTRQEPWTQDEVFHFELSISPDGKRSPVGGWDIGEDSVFFLHDVRPGPGKIPGWDITFALYDRESVFNDPRRIFLTDWDCDSSEIEEMWTIHWNPPKPEIVKLWGEQWQILRIIDHSRQLDDGWNWETTYLVIARRIP